jgi:alpha-D-ribose 1-methylphosphonate 5-triphosphate synthase subunit PhnH
MIREIAYDEVFDSQKHFRLLMECMSMPGKLNYIQSSQLNSPKGINQATILTGFALMNSDVSFYLDKRPSEIEEYLIVNTSAVLAPMPEADFIFMHGNRTGSLLSEANTGLDIYPESGALILVDLESISKESLFPSIRLVLEGPGIDGKSIVYVQGLDISFLKIIKDQHLTYPLGFDFIFTSNDNAVLCIPRSSNINWEMIN